MIRASLTNRRYRNVTSRCNSNRLLAGGCSAAQRKNRGNIPIAHSARNGSQYHSLTRGANAPSYHFRARPQQHSCNPAKLWDATNCYTSHRTRCPAHCHLTHRTRTSPTYMSTKPSYDFLNQDEEDDNDGEDDQHELRWLNRSSGMDNLSQYDNYHQYDSLPGETRNRVSDEDSLLDLLNDKTSEFGGGAVEQPDEASHSPFYNGGNGNHLPLHDTTTEPSLINLLNGSNDNSYQCDEQFQDYDNDTNQQWQYEFSEEAIVEDQPELHELLNEDTKEIDKNSKYKELAKLQLQLEAESTEEATLKRLEEWQSARDRSDYKTLPVVRKTLDSWYGPLTEAIELEQLLYLNGDYQSCSFSMLNKGQDGDDPQRMVRDRSIYGALLCLLPPRKIAVLLAHGALSLTLAHSADDPPKVVHFALYLANIIETEVNVSRTLRVQARKRRLKSDTSSDEENSDDDSDQSNMGEETTAPSDAVAGNQSSGTSIDNWSYTATHLQYFLNDVSTMSDQILKGGKARVRPDRVRKRCREILLAEGYISSEENYAERKIVSANDEFEEWTVVQKVKLGAALIRLLLDHAHFTFPTDRHNSEPASAFQFLTKRTRDGKGKNHISLHPDLFHIAVNEEFSSTASFLPFAKTSSRAQPMVVPPNDWVDSNNGGYETIKAPFMRTRHCKTQEASIRKAELGTVMDGLNVLGNIPWKVNQTVLDVALKCWEDGVVLGDIPSQDNLEVPPLPGDFEYFDWKTLGDVEKKIHLEEFLKYKDALTRHKRFKQKNMDLHSLRCSAMLKLNQAKKFKDFEEIFFPYNVDFRGRAYPVPPHLSIVGSDLCRSLLMFAHPKPLGKNGLYWLKVHLANLAGADKMSFDGRAQFAEENMDNIRAAVRDPFGENVWWKGFDDPFQGLATCHEIVKAVESGDPENYMCSLPVHMDGSCNGLQHYAALGRDKDGGKAVNLCMSDKPQDVYSGVMHEVARRVAQDADEMLPFDENKGDMTKAEKDLLKKVNSARLVNGLIDRGVVKRTVMTSVYGVTYIGAKNQIKEKIEEKLEERGHDIVQIEPEINMACGYLASLTMEVMGEQFKGARQTMNWLTECARMIAGHGQPVSFVSPVGVPVVQPYRQRRSFVVLTLLQQVVVTNDSDKMPLHKQRQVSAFPPNYVHSLDASHMIMTAIEMNKRGLLFSAVHDSYWTHPCDIEEMNTVLRETFIDLYKRPLLQELKAMWEMRYPSITFPPIPPEGELDLNDVRLAPYFFQ